MTKCGRSCIVPIAAAILAAASAGSGCQETAEPTVTLTQAQWEEVRSNILPAAPPKLTHKVGANFGDTVELIGLEVSPATPAAGKEVTITWYWKCLAETDINWQVFVHLDHMGKEPSRQGLDHHPVRDLYQTSRWKVGEIIKDEQKVRIRPDFPGGKASLFVGLWNQAGGNRLPVKNKAAVKADGGDRVDAASLNIAGKIKTGSKPKVYLGRQRQGDIVIDGKLDDDAWKKAARITLGPAGGGRAHKQATRARLLWDETHLYVGMFGEDADVWGDLTKRDADTWTQEVFEVFIDPDGDSKQYVELQVTPQNTIFDAKFAEKLGRGEGTRQQQIDTARAWNSGLESAVHVDGTLNNQGDKDRSWSAEIKLPMADIPGGPPKIGSAWRINFYRFDAPRDAGGKAGRQVAWAWSPAKGSFHNVHHFGTVRFVGAGGLELGSVKPNKKTVPTRPAPGAVVPDKPGSATPTDESPPDRPE